MSYSPSYAHGFKSTFATLPAASTVPAGAVAVATDIGQTSTQLVSSGTYWRVPTATDIVLTTSAQSTLTGLDQIVRSVTLPAGILRACRSFSIKALFGRAGTTDDATTVTLRLGSAGTTADTALLSSAALVKTTKSLAVEQLYTVTSATNIRLLGAQGGLTAWDGVASTVAYPVDVTVPNIDTTQLKLSAGVHMAGTTDLGYVHTLILTLLP